MQSHEYPRLSNEDVVNRELESSLELWEKARDVHDLIGVECEFESRDHLLTGANRNRQTRDVERSRLSKRENSLERT